MRFMSNEEREEEKRYNVSTKLTLFTDPWTIKKEIATSIVGRLLLKASFLRKDIMRYLTEDDQKMVHGDGLRVNMYDHDTDSTHKLLSKEMAQVSKLCSPPWMAYVFCSQKSFEGKRWDWDILGSFWFQVSFSCAFSSTDRNWLRFRNNGFSILNSSFCRSIEPHYQIEWSLHSCLASCRWFYQTRASIFNLKHIMRREKYVRKQINKQAFPWTKPALNS